MSSQRIRRIPRRRGSINPPRSRAFFLELLINVFIFLICAIVALTVFVESRAVTDESAALSQLSLDAETLAENFKAHGGEPADLLVLDDRATEGYSGVVDAEGTLTYHYNRRLVLSHAQEAVYTLVVEPAANANEQVSAIDIAGYSGDDELFSFQVTHYEPPEGR